MDKKIIFIVSIKKHSKIKDIGLGEECDDFRKKFLYTSTPYISRLRNYLLISQTKGVKLSDAVKETDKWDILLISDHIEFKDWAECILSLSSTDNTYVMYHTRLGRANDENAVGSILSSFKKKKKGRHENSEDAGYPYLKEIIKSWSSNDNGGEFDANKFNGKFDVDKFNVAFNEIANWIYPEKIEAVLKFLHGCLGKQPEQANFDRLKEAGIDITGIGGILESNPSEDKYMTEELSILRDKLLIQVEY
ncbi:MAG: hypothetical protein LBD80_07715 [Tannerella sp.]|jgi:hypothetical protein|nr:hypothetical protein [Tannerella sp.]